jgi:hypothetical protein
MHATFDVSLLLRNRNSSILSKRRRISKKIVSRKDPILGKCWSSVRKPLACLWDEKNARRNSKAKQGKIFYLICVYSLWF